MSKLGQAAREIFDFMSADLASKRWGHYTARPVTRGIRIGALK